MKKKFRNLKICFLAFAVIGVVFSACKKDDDNGPGSEQDLVAEWEISQHISISKENGKIVDNDTTKGGRIVLNDDKTAVFRGSDKYKWEYSGGKLKLNYTGKIEDEDEQEDYNEEFDMLELTGTKMVMEYNMKGRFEGVDYEYYEKYICIKKSSNQVSDEDKDDDGPDSREGLAGTWKVIQFIYEEKEDGKIVDSDKYGEEKGETFVLNEDGTSDFDTSSAEKCTWKYQNGKLNFYWKYDDGESDDMSYSVVELTPDNLVMEWKGTDKYDGHTVEMYEKYICHKVKANTGKNMQGKAMKSAARHSHRRL